MILGEESSQSGSATRSHVCFAALNIYPILAGSRRIELAGGAEVQQVILARALHADGFRVSVLSNDFGQPDVIDCAGVQVYRLPRPGRRGIKGLRFVYPHITDFVAGLKRIDADVVYVRGAGFHAAGAAWYARTRGRQLVYACAHDMEFDPAAKWPPGIRDAQSFRLALRFTDRILLQNVQQLALLKKNFGKDGIIVPNCFSEPLAGRAAPDGHVLWVGTVKPMKRPDRFIELARQFPSTKFTMVGGADNQTQEGKAYYRDIQDLAAGTPNVSFVGYVPFSEVGRHFDNASVFVSTSDLEGFPNTFLQAWIRGVPTVSLVRPEIAPGETGTIACHDMDDMAARVRSLTTNQESWHAASTSCEEHFVRTHSTGAVLHRYRSLFNGPSARRRYQA